MATKRIGPARTLTALLLFGLSTGAARVEPRVTISCSYSSYPDPSDTCESFASSWAITVKQLVALNPSINCADFDIDGRYCVLGTVSPDAMTTSSSRATSNIPATTHFTAATTQSEKTLSTITMTATTASAAQHQPQQSGLIASCATFYQVKSGDSCDSIQDQFGITGSQFVSWNPSINSGCSNLWTGYYVCVGVPGTSTAPLPSKTSPSNGISTPTPVQSGTTTDCAAFYQVRSGDTCSSISSQANIGLTEFYSWNPAVGASCNSLWTDYYVCISAVSPKSTPTTTSRGNGIATPTPAEPGMVGNCNRFHLAHSGDTCAAIAPWYGITAAQIIAWNDVGSDCSKLWTGYYVCTGTM